MTGVLCTKCGAPMSEHLARLDSYELRCPRDEERLRAERAERAERERCTCTHGRIGGKHEPSCPLSREHLLGRGVLPAVSTPLATILGVKRTPVEVLNDVLAEAEKAIAALGFEVEAAAPIAHGAFFLRWSKYRRGYQLVVLPTSGGEELPLLMCTLAIRIDAANALPTLLEALQREKAGHDTEIANAIAKAKSFIEKLTP